MWLKSTKNSGRNLRYIKQLLPPTASVNFYYYYYRNNAEFDRNEQGKPHYGK